MNINILDILVSSFILISLLVKILTFIEVTLIIIILRAIT
jgi:hypothetical protein